jgi:SAM-dependent methyltransferase
MPEIFIPPASGWRSDYLDKLEIPAHLAVLQPLKGRRVLELGCGDGRFTTLMSQCGADVLAVDFSLEALQRLRSNLRAGVTPTTYKIAPWRKAGGDVGRVGLVRADASDLRVAPRCFQRALSATPLDSRDERMKMYHMVADALTDDGRYCGGVEYDGFYHRILGLPVLRRYSPGGVLIEHLDIATMRRELAPYFGRLRLQPIRVHVPFLKQLKLPMMVSVAVARLCGVVPGLRHLGELLLACAEHPIRLPIEGTRRVSYLGAIGLYRRYKRRLGEEAAFYGKEPI